MKILSLFDGISCAKLALDRAKIPVEKYYASEIDPYAIAISKENNPDIVQLGDVKDVIGLLDNDYMLANPFEERRMLVSITDRSSMTEKAYHDEIDLLIGGSPCQDLSIAKKNREGLKGSRSSLFWEYVRILKEVKPKYFILENVNSMKNEDKNIITETLGVEPIMINASLVSAQNRKRLFWTNIPGVTLPEDRGVVLKDVLENGICDRDKSLCIDANYHKGASWDHYKKKGVRQLIRVGHFNKGGQGDRIYSPEGKSVSLSANGGGRGAKTGLYKVGEKVRKLTPTECERLQGVPDNYTLVQHPKLKGMMSDTQRYKVLGNAFNVDVVAHILSFIPITNNS